VFNLVKNRFVLMKSPATGELGKLNRLLQEKVSLSRDSMGKSRKKAKEKPLLSPHPARLASVMVRGG
jgi:hypothetical protein